MKQLIFLLLLAPCPILLAQHSYQEGLENCKRKGEAQTKDNSNAFPFVPSECIIGSRAPEFAATTMDGKSFTSDHLKGKITVINFWMISCPPCIAEIPGLNNVVQKYGRDKFNYVAIGMDDEKDIRDFLVRNPWQFDQIAAASSLIIDLFQMRWGFPTTFVIDQEGVIIGAFSGGKTDESAVKEIENTLTSIFALAGKGK